MPISHYRHPLLFYVLATLIPWSFWFAAGRISHMTPLPPGATVLASALGFAGLLAPALIAFALMARDPVLRTDLARRLFSFSSVRPRYWLIAVTLILVTLLLAQAISLLFGYPATQFRLAGHASFSSGVFPVWFLLIAAPLIEELAWHSYGTDVLRARFSLLTASLIFGLFWGIWHIPLASIKDYYQSNVVAEGWIYGANFLISILPFVVVMNWLYYKAGRNIAITIVFHITAGLYNEMFQTHPMSKVIQTGLLTLFAIWLVVREPAFFLKRDLPPDHS
ncbi:MAG TPA: CPBP family intramembrane metalloprotease [Aliiroseovarius sp.]|nr:CPBP family intramembrane metalloprotease [Aliiroseovarius sp.]